MASWPYNTTAWKRLRASKLLASPLCVVCKRRGRLARANTVDHVQAINAGGEAFPSLDGLMSLCGRCHNEKTAAVDHPGCASSARRFKGCDADGNPVDPGDAWHGGHLKDEEGQGQGPMGESTKYLVSKPTRRMGL